MKPNENKPTEWFEPLYKNASIDGDGVPWANMKTHPYFEQWLQENTLLGKGKRALVVGCGLGDDAITLEELGFEVSAFDVSHSAINLCKKRFPNSKVAFTQADLFKAPGNWKGAFDFVLEIYTIQALPPKYENEVISNIASWVRNGGTLLTVASVSNIKRTFENGPPWLLNPDHVQKIEAKGFSKVTSEISEKADLGNSVYISSFFK